MAVVDYYLKITGIDGESKDSKNKGWIELESWSWGVAQTGSGHTGGGSGAGKASAQDFHFVMKINKASPKLMLACANGQHFTDATLIARKAGKDQQEFLKIKLQQILVSSYQTGGANSSDIVPVDQVSLNFAKMNIDYKEQQPDGTLGGTTSAGRDFNANKDL